MKRLVIVLIGLGLIPSAAVAQTEGRFQTGVVSWTPTLTLRDAGVDTNLYSEAENPRRDTLAMLAPQVSGVAKLAAADVRFQGQAEFVYYQRYTEERSINRGANVRADFRGTRVRPFMLASFLDTRERNNSEIDIRARRASRDAAAGIGIAVSPRGTVEVEGSVGRHTFRQGVIFRGIELAEQLNKNAFGATVRFNYAITPLTHFVAEARGTRDRFISAPQNDANNLRIVGGFEFDPTAVLSGRATIGYHRLDPVGALAFGYEGVTGAANLRYVLLQRTRFDVLLGRDVEYSIEAQPYFVRTMYGLEVRHNVVGPLDVIARGSSEELDYPGIPERFVHADVARVNSYGGAIALKPGPHLQLTVNYEVTDRDSERLADRRYERRRVYTNITYGF